MPGRKRKTILPEYSGKNLNHEELASREMSSLTRRNVQCPGLNTLLSLLLNNFLLEVFIIPILLFSGCIYLNKPVSSQPIILNDNILFYLDVQRPTSNYDPIKIISSKRSGFNIVPRSFYYTKNTFYIPQPVYNLDSNIFISYFNLKGEYIGNMTLEDKTSHPIKNIAIDKYNNIYLSIIPFGSCTDERYVLKVNEKGNFIFRLGPKGINNIDDNFFYYLRDIYIDEKNIHIKDKSTIYTFTLDGKFIKKSSEIPNEMKKESDKKDNIINKLSELDNTFTYRATLLADDGNFYYLKPIFGPYQTAWGEESTVVKYEMHKVTIKE